MPRRGANTDTPGSSAASVTYELPFGRGRNSAPAASPPCWPANAIWTFQIGCPLAILGTGVQRPHTTGLDATTSGNLESRLNSYIHPAAFSVAPEFTFGILSREIALRGPGQANFPRLLQLGGRISF